MEMISNLTTELASEGLTIVGGRLVEEDLDETAWGGDPLGVAVRWLREDGVEIMGVDPYAPAGAVLIAEAANLAAKVIDPEYYRLKPALWTAVAEMAGVAAGRADDGTVALYHPASGVVHAHMPGGCEITGDWKHPWSGVRRQSWAFRALRCARSRRLLAWMTAPDEGRAEWYASVCARRAHRRHRCAI